ncbi:MAG: tetratricopeptide repeat-containing serine protease family protein [Cyanobacteria bacterium P01_F01_bin.143]
MKNFLATIFVTAVLIIVQSQVTLSQTIDSVEAIAKKVTVQIYPSLGDTGSGVIIGKNGNTYYVLTARHVLDSTGANEEAYVDTYDGEGYQIDTSKIKKLPEKVDLLLLQFESEQDYPIATISQFNYRLYRNNNYELSLFSDASAKQYIFVSGWPLTGETKRVFSPGYLFDNAGAAMSLQPDLSNNEFGGYELLYTNLTHSGMSGGPVFDTQGRLIGIHGRADARQIGEDDEIIEDYLDEVGSPIWIKVGLSQGIPIQTFLSWAADHPVYDYLNIEDSAPSSLSQAVVNDWQPPIKIKDTNNPYHWLEKGNQLWRIDRVAEAGEAFDNATRLREDLYLAWFAKGFALGFDEKYDLALEACNKAIELQVNPSRYKYEAYRCKAGALQALQQFKPALDSLDKAMDLNSNNPADWMSQGELYYALGEYDESLNSFRKAIELREKQNLPSSALLYNNLGFINLELGQYKFALQDVEQAISVDPSYAPAWSNKGLILETVGRNQEALDAYDQATELNPNDYIVWTNKAFVFYKLERYEEAKNSLETALSIKPDYEPAMNSLEELMLQIQQ